MTRLRIFSMLKNIGFPTFINIIAHTRAVCLHDRVIDPFVQRTAVNDIEEW